MDKFKLNKMNFHTHTAFCDGKNKPEDMVKKAIGFGFSHLGFSEHAYVPFEKKYCMSPDTTKRYIEEINRLKYAYRDDIKIYCGLEVDYFSEIDTSDFDYIIGSCHYVGRNGEYYPIDGTPEKLQETIKAFNNDVYELIEVYYSQVCGIVNKFNVDIIGHFDLIAKFNDGDRFFSEKDIRYTKPATDTLDSLLEKGCIFEVNTGAMARGFKSEPYPLPDFIEYIKENNGSLILSSDCHNLNLLDYAFDEVANRYDIDLSADKLLNRIEK